MQVNPGVVCTAPAKSGTAKKNGDFYKSALKQAASVRKRAFFNLRRNEISGAAPGILCQLNSTVPLTDSQRKSLRDCKKTGLTVFPIVYNTAAKPYSCKLSGTRNRAANSMLPYIQNEMAFVIIEESVFFHLSEFRRQSASLDAEVIRKLLP